MVRRLPLEQPAARGLARLTLRYATFLLPSIVFGLIYYFVPNVSDILVKDV